MEESNIVALMMLFLLVVLGNVGYFLNKEARKEAYLKGQSDCLQGDIKITLVEFKDGERKWYFTNELKDLKEYTEIKLSK